MRRHKKMASVILVGFMLMQTNSSRGLLVGRILARGLFPFMVGFTMVASGVAAGAIGIPAFVGYKLGEKRVFENEKGRKALKVFTILGASTFALGVLVYRFAPKISDGLDHCFSYFRRKRENRKK